MNETMARWKYGMLLAVVLSLEVGLLVRPSFLERARLAQEIDDLTNQLERVPMETAALDAARQRFDDLTSRVHHELKPIPERSDLHGLMESISIGADRLPLGPRNLRRGKESARGDVLGFGLSIETSGSFTGVFDLLRHIEELPRPVCVREVFVESTGEEGDGEVTATIGLDAFYRVTQVADAATQ